MSMLPSGLLDKITPEEVSTQALVFWLNARSSVSPKRRLLRVSERLAYVFCSVKLTLQTHRAGSNVSGHKVLL